MQRAALPLYAAVREAGLSGIVVDLGSPCEEGLDALGGGARVISLGPDEAPQGVPRLTAAASLLPFAEATVDALLWPLAPVDLPVDRRVLAEARRVLSPGGMLAVQLPARDSSDEDARPPGRQSLVSELDGWLRRHFPHITTMEQRPNGGYRLTRSGGLATSALPPRAAAPSHFLLLCSKKHRRWPAELEVAFDVARFEEETQARERELASILGAARGEVARRTLAIGNLGQELGRLRAELAQREASCEELELGVARTEELARELEATRSRAELAETRVATLEERVSHLSGRLADGEQRLAVAESARDEESSRADEAERLWKRFEESFADSEARVLELEQRLGGAIRRGDDLAEEVEVLRAASEGAASSHRAAESRASEAETERDAAERWAKENERRLAEAQDVLEALAAERRRAATQITTLEERIESEQVEREKELRQRSSERAELEGEDAAGRLRIAELEDTCNCLRTELDAARPRETSHGELETKLAAAEEEGSRQRAELLEMSTAMARLEGESAGSQLRIGELEQARGLVRAKLEVVRAVALENEARCAAAERTAEDLARELEEDRRERAVELDALHNQAEARLARGWDAERRLEKTVAELALLRKELDSGKESRREEAAWALVMPEHGLPPEALPEIVSVLHRGRRLRALLSRLAAVTLAPPGEMDDDFFDV